MKSNLEIDPKCLDYNCKTESKDYKYLKKHFGEFNSPKNINGEWGFKYISFNGTYNQFTNQYIITIAISKNEKNIKDIAEEIKFIMKYIKTGEDGYKFIKIFGHSPEYGVYEIGFKDETWFLLKYYYHNLTAKQFDNLEELIEHVIKNHYYGE